ncbi:aldo/keto reductase [Bacillus sp. Bva_UNVM-123]|uniref:aldo/keto reductase n=1 Tax=Bacillus sp. Bva_UNVM-123 TaxID=2829798 RepID=UPI00391F4A72
MKKRKLGNSDLYVSELGLGCMSLGTDPIKAHEIIEEAIRVGINFFDTADLYDYGENEMLVGQALKRYREQLIIATKGGNRWNEQKNGWRWDPSKKYLKEAVKDSLKRLGVDYIDLYQLHGGTIEDPIEEIIEAFEELKADGYIRYYGISSIRPNVIKEFVKKSNISSVMMQYSILDRRPEEEALPLLQNKGIGVMTRGPLAKGLLTNKMLEKAIENSYLDYSATELKDVIYQLREKISTRNSMTEIALHYNLANPTVSSVITGASSVEQIRENAKAVQATPLSDKEQAVIQSIVKMNTYGEHR